MRLPHAESTDFMIIVTTLVPACACSVGIDTLCRHNFQHNRYMYIWKFENNARIIGSNPGIIRRYPSANTTLNAHVQ